ncbi:hypothetical protein IX51_02660 [uncultured archaeon]|nr:hypothetical protein IX51_02660 [uncultured archaeon]
MRILEVVDYDPRWPESYENEAETIRGIFGSNIVDIQHIGSTSVPGLKAKPTIDIMVSVESLLAVDEVNSEMKKAGFEALGEYGIPGRRFFKKVRFVDPENWVHSVHVHVFFRDDKENLRRHLAVREFLKAHPGKAEVYGKLKAEVAAKHPNDNEAYISGKEKFVTELQKEAMEWYSRRPA